MSAYTPFTQIGMHVGDGSSAYCFSYDRRSPILHINTGDATITVSAAAEDVDDAALSFARELLASAQTFADEIERLHAERAALAEMRRIGSAA